MCMVHPSVKHQQLSVSRTSSQGRNMSSIGPKGPSFHLQGPGETQKPSASAASELTSCTFRADAAGNEEDQPLGGSLV